MRALLLLPGLLLSLPVFGQTPPTALPGVAARRQLEVESGRRQARPDSLEQVFYRAPPYVVASYYRNARRLPWSAAMQLYLEKKGRKLVVQPDSGNRYLLPPLSSDSLNVGVAYRGRKMLFSGVPARYFTHGATIIVGRFNRAYLTRGYRRQLAGGNYSPPLAALQAIDSVSLAQWRQARRVRGVKYQLLTPRVYGDGMVQTTYAPLLR